MLNSLKRLIFGEETRLRHLYQFAIIIIPVQISGQSIVAPLNLLLYLRFLGIFENQVPRVIS